MVGEAERDRVSAAHGGAGEGEVVAQLTGGAAEQPRAADVGGEADADLRHPEFRPLGDHTHRTVCGDPHATTEHDAVHDGDIGLRVVRNEGVELVLVRPE